jgi:hypothetical protein
MEEVEGEDRRPASPPQQRIHPGEGGGHVEGRRRGSIPDGENEDEIPMFARFAERGLSLPASNFFKGLMGYYGIEYLNLNPNCIFHTAVLFISAKLFWGSSPIGSCSRSSSG